MHLLIASFALLTSTIAITSIKNGWVKITFGILAFALNAWYIALFWQSIYEQAIVVIQVANWKAAAVSIPFILIVCVTLLLSLKSLETFCTQFTRRDGFALLWTSLSAAIFISSVFAVVYEFVWVTEFIK